MRYLFPAMLNTALPSFRMLTLRTSRLTSAGLAQSAALTCLYQLILFDLSWVELAFSENGEFSGAIELIVSVVCIAIGFYVSLFFYWGVKRLFRLKNPSNLSQTFETLLRGASHCRYRLAPGTWPLLVQWRGLHKGAIAQPSAP